MSVSSRPRVSEKEGSEGDLTFPGWSLCSCTGGQRASRPLKRQPAARSSFQVLISIRRETRSATQQPRRVSGRRVSQHSVCMMKWSWSGLARACMTRAAHWRPGVWRRTARTSSLRSAYSVWVAMFVARVQRTHSRRRGLSPKSGPPVWIFLPTCVHRMRCLEDALYLPTRRLGLADSRRGYCTPPRAPRRVAQQRSGSSSLEANSAPAGPGPETTGLDRSTKVEGWLLYWPEGGDEGTAVEE